MGQSGRLPLCHTPILSGLLVPHARLFEGFASKICHFKCIYIHIYKEGFCELFYVAASRCRIADSAGRACFHSRHGANAHGADTSSHDSACGHYQYGGHPDSVFHAASERHVCNGAVKRFDGQFSGFGDVFWHF